MNNLWKLIAVAIGAVLVACQWTPPQSSALEEARRALNMARKDPLVAQSARPELEQAVVALRRAERSWIDTRDEALTSHLAYVAYQRVAIARNLGLQREAEQRLQRAKAEGENLLAAESPREPAAAAVPAGLIPTAAAATVAPVAAATPAKAELPAAAPAAEPIAPVMLPAPQAQPPGAAPAALAPARPANRVQAQAAPADPQRGARTTARARDDRRIVAHRGSPRTLALRAAARKRALALQAVQAEQARLAAARPEVWYLDLQGRPPLVPPPAAADTRTAVAALEPRPLRRRAPVIDSGAHPTLPN